MANSAKSAKASKIAQGNSAQVMGANHSAPAAPAANSAPTVFASPAPGRFDQLLRKLKSLKGVVVAIAGVGAVASGLVGYYTTYKTVASSSIQTASSAGKLNSALNSKSIAVLPFVNMSSDKDQEYFADGISEELLNQLAKIHELSVIARTSSFFYKGKEVKVEQIAKELNVAHILEGSIRKSGNKIRITAQLIRTADSSHLWSETYDRDIADIFAVQDEISAAVVGELKIRLLGAAPKAKVIDPQAYALFLQAKPLARQGSIDGNKQAIVLLQQALRLAPEYAEAWADLAGIYFNQTGNVQMPITQGMRLARAAANKALQSDPGLALGHAWLGRIAMNFDADLAAAAQHLSKALTLEQENTEVLRNATALLQYLGRLEQALAVQQAVVQRDPLSSPDQHALGLTYLYLGRADQAISSLKKALSFSPARLVSHFGIGLALLQQGQAQAALAEMTLEPLAGSWGQIGLPMAWHALGNKAKAQSALAELIRALDKEAAFNIAYVQADLGNSDAAFAWLDKAVLYQDPGLAEIVVNPQFANLKKDPRWLPFLRKLGKAPEQLAAIRFEVKLPAK